MESSIAFSIGIGLNRSLRSRLRALAGASESQPIFVRHMQTSAWIEIDPKGSVAARRQKPEGLPSIDLGQAVTREPALGDAVYAASAETRALRRAWKPMEPLVHGWGSPSRQQFGRLIEWSPVLEPLAYRCATRIGSLMCWPTRRSARRSRRSRTGPRSPGLRRGRLHRGLRHRARNAPDRRTCGSARHPSRGGSIMTYRTATAWAQARALYEAIFGGRRSSDPCAFLRSRGE